MTCAVKNQTTLVTIPYHTIVTFDMVVVVLLYKIVDCCMRGAHVFDCCICLIVACDVYVCIVVSYCLSSVKSTGRWFRRKGSK
jgi:hypothetical protein